MEGAARDSARMVAELEAEKANRSNTTTLTINQIVALADFAGITVSPSNFDIESDSLIVITDDPAMTTLSDQDGEIVTKETFSHVAWFDEYPEEGSIGLGDPINKEPSNG